MEHNALQEEEEEVERIFHELEITYDSLKRTQNELQESNMEFEKLCRELEISHPSYCTLDSQLYKEDCIHDFMEEPYVRINHEEHSYLQVLEERVDMENVDQVLVLHQEDHELP